jgi:hypothetical protein
MSLSICGAVAKSTRAACQNAAGKGTNHLGQGRCSFHGGSTPITRGLYSNLQRTPLGPRMAEIQNDPHLHTLERELVLVKGVLEQCAENYQRQGAALRAWQRAESPAYQTLIKANDPVEIRDAVVELRATEPKRPAELPDPKILATLVAEIGRIQDRIRKAETIVTARQMSQFIDRMASVVRQFTDDATTMKIRDGWMNLAVEGR